MVFGLMIQMILTTTVEATDATAAMSSIEEIEATALGMLTSAMADGAAEAIDRAKSGQIKSSQ